MNPNLSFKQKMTKKAFEARLVQEFGLEQLSQAPYMERDDVDPEKRVKVNLYYVGGAHRATWFRGEGWIFKGKEQS